jgi:hypothetical protein
MAEVTGLPDILPTVLVTRLHDAEPDHVAILPTPSLWPFLAAIATTVMFVGSVFTPWAVVWGAVPVGITLIGWFWPDKEEAARMLSIEVKPSEGEARVVALREALS